MPDTNHVTIPLNPDLALVVRADYAEDDETARLVEKCRELLNRTAHISEIKAAIDKWLAAEDEDAIDSVLGMLGWTSNSRLGADELARAALALLELSPLSDVIACADHCQELLVRESAMNGGAS